MSFLSHDGLVELINYLHTELDNTLKKNEQITLPNDLVHLEDLNIYAKKSDIPEGQDLSSYAQLEDLAAYATLASLNNFATKSQLNDYATTAALAALAAKLNGVYHFRGSVDDLVALQAIQNPEEGDVYNLRDTGMNAAWDGERWDDFGSIVDLNGYVREEDVQAITSAELNRILYSGKSAVIDNINSFNAMLENDEAEIKITLNKNLAVTEPIEIPEGKKVILDLGGKTISGQIPIQGTGGEIILKNGIVQGTSDAVYLTEGSKLTLDGASVISARGNGVSAWNGSEVVINSGSITSQEAGIAGFKNSTITINGGIITGIDNGAVMGNGSAAGSANDGSNMNVIMNGGKLVGHITSAGYQACGVYIPNTGSFTMNGGEIVSDGCGICMRGGQVNLNAGIITANGPSGFVGKVGDSRVTVGSYAIVYDVDSKYPGMESLELNIANGVILQGTDGDISILPPDTAANITDNRNI